MAKSKSRGPKSSKSAAAKSPGHYTSLGTRKFQAHGPVEWGKVFLRAAGGAPEAFGIRAALAFAVANAGKWSAKGERASDTAAGEAARAGVTVRKAPKAPRAPKAPEQVEIPEAK